MTLLEKIEEILNDRKYGFTVRYHKDWVLLNVPEDTENNKIKFAIYYFNKDTLILRKKVYENSLSAIGKTL